MSCTSKVSEKLTEVLESSMRKFHRLKTGTTKKMEQGQAILKIPANSTNVTF
jgi:hypothetical protein